MNFLTKKEATALVLQEAAPILADYFNKRTVAHGEIWQFKAIDSCNFMWVNGKHRVRVINGEFIIREHYSPSAMAWMRASMAKLVDVYASGGRLLINVNNQQEKVFYA